MVSIIKNVRQSVSQIYDRSEDKNLYIYHLLTIDSGSANELERLNVHCLNSRLSGEIERPRDREKGYCIHLVCYVYLDYEHEPNNSYT